MKRIYSSNGSQHADQLHQTVRNMTTNCKQTVTWKLLRLRPSSDRFHETETMTDDRINPEFGAVG